MSNCRSLLVIHGIFSGTTAVLMPLVMNFNQWQSFMLSQAFIWVSLLTLTFSVYVFFLKKNIALLTGLIVFKWPILIYMAYRLTESIEVHSLSFSVGLIPLFVSGLTWSYFQSE